MDGISKAVAAVTKYIQQAWDENTASAAALVFIPCLLVAASRFPAETIMFGAMPCYWLLTDALIVCFTISALAAVIDICLDIGYFANQVPNDCVPLIVGGDMSYPTPDSSGSYSGTVVARIIFALIIRSIGSCFALLTLSSATLFTLVPLSGMNTTNGDNVYPSPPQCTDLSDGSYNYKLFFGFGTIAAVFIALRLGLVQQSHPLGYDASVAAGHHHHHDHEKGMAVGAVVVAKTPADDEHELEDVKGGGGDDESSDDKEERRKHRHRSGHHRSKRHHRGGSHKRRRDDESDEPEHEEEKRQEESS